jgi:Ca2+-transporting ATPase
MGPDTKEGTSYVKRLYVKGASEIVLDACTHHFDASGEIRPLDTAARTQYDTAITQYADRALRTLCLAYRDVTSQEIDDFSDEDAPIENLICIGIVGIQDPLRPGVAESVRACRRAGVCVKMVSGDGGVPCRMLHSHLQSRSPVII